MSIKTLATVLKNHPVKAEAAAGKQTAHVEIIAATSALWKFAWAANNATSSPKDKEEFKQTQQELAKYLLDTYKTPTIKAAERKIAALGARAKQLAAALVSGDTRALIKLMSQTKLGLQQIGVLATIVGFYSAEQKAA